MLRKFLRYKCDHAGVVFAQVNEAYTTQTCSCCTSRTGPKGIAGLGIRQWECSVCGTLHDRDINAARNILATGMRQADARVGELQDGLASTHAAAGRGRLAEGIPVL